ncbi:hypothetical protein GGE65_008146 [Skermanella aerolata]|uniref:plasmid mobilization protein n=1 Tax=Skermanella aerolata TaxID=393310 RepID=UPI003D207017
MDPLTERPAEAATSVGKGVKPPGSGRRNTGRMEGVPLRVKVSRNERAAFNRIARELETSVSGYVRSMALDPTAVHRTELKRIKGIIGQVHGQVNSMSKRVNSGDGIATAILESMSSQLSAALDALLPVLERKR